MDPKTSLQEIAARRGAAAPVVRGHRERARPRQAVPRDRRWSATRRRHRRGLEQEAGRDGRGARGLDAASTTALTCRSCPRSRSCAPASRRPSPAPSSSASRCSTPRSLRRHDAASGDFEALARRRPHRGGRAPRQVPLAAASATRPTPLVVHLGMSGQVLLRSPATGRRPAHPHPHWTSSIPSTASCRVDFVDQRIFGSMAVDRSCPPPTARSPATRATSRGSGPGSIPARSRTSPATRSTRLLRRGLLRRARPARHRHQARAARPEPDQRHRQHLRRRGALGGAHALRPAGRVARARRARELLAEVREVLGKALAEGGTSFDAQYVNVNGASGYFSHSLNAYGQAGQAVPALRHADRARAVHEPRLALLPALPGSVPRAPRRRHSADAEVASVGRRPQVARVAPAAPSPRSRSRAIVDREHVPVLVGVPGVDVGASGAVSRAARGSRASAACRAGGRGARQHERVSLDRLRSGSAGSDSSVKPTTRPSDAIAACTSVVRPPATARSSLCAHACRVPRPPRRSEPAGRRVRAIAARATARSSSEVLGRRRPPTSAAR